MAQRQGFLKEGGLALFLSNFFRVYHFLYSEIILNFPKLRYAYEERFFSTTIIL